MSEISELTEKLRAEGEKIVKYFEGLKDEQWAIEIYTEEANWAIRDILAHLMSSEQAFVKLFENIRQGGIGVAGDFEIDRYNARQQEKTKELGVLELIRLYKSERGNMIKWISGIKESDLKKTGRHPFLGQTTLREMIRMVYLHNQIHCRDIKIALNRFVQPY